MTFYKTVTALGSDELDKKVEAELKDGWECQGGVSVSMAIDKTEIFHEQYAQALIKIKTER